MFERFTDRSRRVVVLAQEEARRLNHSYIGTEHLLLGLLGEGEGLGPKALASFGATLDKARNAVESVIGTGPSSPSGHIPFTPNCKQCLERSLREALQLGHNYIGTEHIVIALTREDDSGAVSVLEALGVGSKALRTKTIELVVGATPPPKPPSPQPLPWWELHGAEVIDGYLWEHSVRWQSRASDHIWLDANAKCGIVAALVAAGWRPPLLGEQP